MSKEITKELLDGRFIFNLDTGVVTNRIKTSRLAKAGVEAGYLSRDGYRQIGISGRMYGTARIIWFFVHGEWPNCIDHVNHLKTDNRIVNLRNVTHAENCKNMSKPSNNTSGVAGVCWNKERNKWGARITVDGERIYLGLFSDLADAATARAAAKVEYGFHQNHA